MLMRTEITKGQTYDRKKEISRIAKGNDEVKKNPGKPYLFYIPRRLFLF